MNILQLLSTSLKITQMNEGVTVNIPKRTINPQDTHYIVSCPLTHKVKRMTIWNVMIYIARHWKILQSADHYFGIWHNHSGYWDYDINISTNDLDLANELTVKHGQLAFYDNILGVDHYVTK